MLHASKEQRTANAVCFHSHTRDKTPISVPEEARQTSTGVLQPITTTVMENGVFALVIKRSLQFYNLMLIFRVTMSQQDCKRISHTVKARPFSGPQLL